VWCELPVGDHTLTYTLTTGPKVQSWKLLADAVLEVVHDGRGNPETTSVFTLQSPDPVTERYRLFGRDTNGQVWWYDGTGAADRPFRDREPYDDGWGQYTAVTALSGTTTHGTGDVVARDRSGVLWYYAGNGTRYADVFKARTKVGPDWNIYDTVVGARDLTGDGRADLIGRDSAGTLWLYQATGSTSAPFAARTKIGGGWDVYRSLTGAGDLTGDGKADLLAADTNGVLWLYRGTGDAAAPYAARVKIGTGWGIYNLLLSPGDLTGDGKPDFVGRSATGNTLYLYAGTGDASAPYASRTLIGPGWTYDMLF
jgi:hypothetical protein